MTTNAWQVKTRKLDKRHDLWKALCLFKSVFRTHHIYKEVWTPKTGEQLLVEIVNIVSLKFASDEAAEWTVDILEPLFYSQ